LKKSTTVFLTGMTAVIVLGVAFFGCSKKQSAATTQGPWKPDRNIEFICQSSAGGGSDMMARAIAQYMRSAGIIEQPIVVDNITGAGGVKAFSYTLEHKGSAYNWQTVNSNFFTAPISGNIKQDYRDYTLLAVIGVDPNVLCVPYNSPFQTFGDIVAAAKASPGKYSIAIGGAGSSGSCITIMLQNEVEIRLNQIPFEGGSDGLTALMGAQVDIGWLTVGELIGPMDNKLVRPIALAEEGRFDIIKDVPTFKELGYDVVFSVPRAIVGSPDMPKEAYDFYCDAFRKLIALDVWKKEYIQPNYIVERTGVGKEECEPIFKDFYNDTQVLYAAMGLAEAGKIE
jgi:putative tricarboxylic transport membrane protein